MNFLSHCIHKKGTPHLSGVPAVRNHWTHHLRVPDMSCKNKRCGGISIKYMVYIPSVGIIQIRLQVGINKSPLSRQSPAPWYIWTCTNRIIARYAGFDKRKWKVSQKRHCAVTVHSRVNHSADWHGGCMFWLECISPHRQRRFKMARCVAGRTSCEQ